MDTIEFFFDIASPYSYLASTQMDALAERTGATVQWRPFLLGGVFKDTGNRMPAAVDLKAAYMLQDLRRWAEHYDVPFRMASNFPLNALLVQRVLTAVDEEQPEHVPELARSLYHAHWVDDRDLTDPSVVAELLSGIGVDAERVLERAGEQAIKDRLRAVTGEAVERGAFGAPTFFVGDEMFFGNDRLTFVEDAVC